MTNKVDAQKVAAKEPKTRQASYHARMLADGYKKMSIYIPADNVSAAREYLKYNFGAR